MSSKGLDETSEKTSEKLQRKLQKKPQKKPQKKLQGKILVEPILNAHEKQVFLLNQTPS